MSNEVDAIGNVEEAVHRPVAAGELRQSRMSRTWQTKEGAACDPQQIEIRITRDLSLNHLHVRVEALHRRTRSAWPNLRLTIHIRNRDIARPAIEQAGASQSEVERTIEYLRGSVARIAIIRCEAVVA